ncbi:hypothetical protein DICPUDRAFT_52805 [Dictyostelium purpureum]|uniref:Amino acid permease/ SLC12A domain-containing protein n=1 Tax=Dictyostelium purpureum TaxID=5786 RepID=F0ZA32_DICPU|nr:uncharacterized protein DICPUDRAFT_52805 [Dictyostelium purpureum]EGC39225.1 hypothetical protein DICPUDRAFT_52805 [Dictyostelium purpureum]|eukprot:XP_003284252.1 hypothetical protein DICPUDRAFT_52805 [Dictyostelium purpureum]
MGQDTTLNLITENEYIGADSTPLAPPRSIGLISLISIGFFLVSGGPFGIEGSVSSGSYVYVLLTFILLPIFWCIPLGLITAELSLMVNKDGGCSVWAEKAFGEYFSLSLGLFSWFATMVDLSLYPLLFVQYYSSSFTGSKDASSDWAGGIEQCQHCRLLMAFAVIIIIVLMNCWGAEQVGIFSTILSITLLSPFIIMVAMGIGHVNLGQVLSVDGGMRSFKEVQWGTLIVTVVWSYSGFDAFGQLAGEIKNPKRNYPIGVVAVMVVTILVYILPLLVGMQYEKDYKNWYDGEFSDVASKVGGQWLNILMCVGGMASSLGLFQANLCTSSRNLYSLSLRGYVPNFFSKLLPRRETPFIAIITNAVVVGLLTLMPFQAILNLDMSIYSIVAALECIIYIKLYIWNPDYDRPYKAINTRWLLPFMATPMIFTGLILILAPWDNQWKTMVAVAFNLAIVLSRYILNRYRARKTKKNNESLDYEQESFIKKYSIN